MELLVHLGVGGATARGQNDAPRAVLGLGTVGVFRQDADYCTGGIVHQLRDASVEQHLEMPAGDGFVDSGCMVSEIDTPFFGPQQ
jgi:hypothetical protein